MSALFLLTLCALLASVKSAPTFSPLNVRQYYGQNMTNNITNTPTPANTTTTDFLKQDGLAAQKMNAEFAAIKATDPCQDGQMACVNASFAQCVQGQWNLSPCAFSDLSCYALPRGDKPGLSLVCDTSANALQRFLSAGLQGGVTGNDNSTNTGSTDPNDPDGDCDEGEETNNPDDDDCDNDGTEAPQGGADDSGDDDSTPSGTATPTSFVIGSVTASSIGVSAVSSQASSTPDATVTAYTESPSSTLQRRQILSSTPSSASTPTATSSSIPSSIPIGASSTVTDATATSSSTNGIVTPTVVIGTDNIVTVTLVSTVTVSATDCAAPGTQTTATSPVGTDAASTIVASIGTSFSPSLPTGSTLTSAPSLSATPSLSTSISSSATDVPPNSVAVSSPSTPPTPTSTSSGFNFFTQSITTPAPQTTPSGSLNIAELLTATV